MLGAPQLHAPATFDCRALNPVELEDSMTSQRCAGRLGVSGLVLAILIAIASWAAPAVGADDIEITLTIKDHKFEPAELKVPAGKPIKLTVKNLDPTPEEFESHALKVEKVITGKATQLIRLKALAKGTYPFVGEYHEKTAKGVIIAE
jgi:plastocyanin